MIARIRRFLRVEGYFMIQIQLSHLWGIAFYLDNSAENVPGRSSNVAYQAPSPAPQSFTIQVQNFPTLRIIGQVKRSIRRQRTAAKSTGAVPHDKEVAKNNCSPPVNHGRAAIVMKNDYFM
jgi:hypothetical protein